MNIERIISMAVRMVMQRLMRSGMNAGMNAVGKQLQLICPVPHLMPWNPDQTALSVLVTSRTPLRCSPCVMSYERHCRRLIW